MINLLRRLTHQAETGQPVRSTSVRRTGRFVARPLVLAAGLALALCIAPVGARAQLSGDMLGQMHTYKTHYNDTLLDIARDSRLGAIELMAANPGVDAWLPGADVNLLLPTAHLLPDAPKKGIVINTAELRMYYYGDPAKPLSFPIGVGRDGYLTPHGSTTVVRKKEKPSWYLTPSEIADHPELPSVIPPGDDNPLGDYAMYLGWHSYLIHGTNIPWGIGRRASRGCIRMYPENIEWLFSRVPIGTQVTVVDQPVKIGRMDGDLYIEVQPSSHQIDVMEETSKAPAPAEPLPLAEWSDRILALAGPDIDRIDWPAVEKALNDRQGYPIRIATSENHAGTPAAQAIPIDKPALAAVALPLTLAAAAAAANKTDTKPDTATKTTAANTGKPASAKQASTSTSVPASKSAPAKSVATKAPETTKTRTAENTPVKAKATAVQTTTPKSAVAQNSTAKASTAPAKTPVAKPAVTSTTQRTASR